MRTVSGVLQLIVLGTLGLAPCFARQAVALEPQPPLSAAQLDSLTAPIALYPDALVAQILTAATYPLEVADAAHWLEDPYNAALAGEALAAALEQESWDLSVKSLVPFPDTLRMMERNLQWTGEIGDAFLAQQADLMDSIQRLRGLALSAGTLQSTPQQAVRTEDGRIIVEPQSPDVVYMPYYDPYAVYGPWPWAAYTPRAFAPPPGIYVSGSAIVFGVGFAVIRPLWGWSYWSWPQHRLLIPPRSLDTRPFGPAPWHHDPDHRLGPPHRDQPPVEHPAAPGSPPRSRVPPPRLPRAEHPARQRPDHPGFGTQPPAHRPGPPDSRLPGSDRPRRGSLPDHQRSPAGTAPRGAPPSGRVHDDRPARAAPPAGSAGSQARPPPSAAPRGGRADHPASGRAPPDHPTTPRAGEPPQKSH